MHEAILKLPSELSSAYLQAYSKCPNLVRIESDPSRFLRYCQGDIDAASRLLAKHWKTRLDVFGPNRAFKPLNPLTGNNALSQTDIETMKSGETIFSIPVSITQDGRPNFYHPDRNGFLISIVYGNRGESTVGKEESVVRCSFYLVMSAVMHGVEVLRSVRFGKTVAVSTFVASKVLEIENSIPVSFSDHWFVFQYPKGGKRMFETTLAAAVGAANSAENADRNISFQLCGTPSEILQKLVPLGYSAEILPPFMGGTWSPTDFGSFLTNSDLHDQDDSTKQAVFDPMEVDNQKMDHEFEATMNSRIASMDLKLTSAYQEALQRCPHLVQTESDPAAFLRLENADAVKAVNRLVHYWYERKASFKESAFLPLTLLDANSALYPEDVALLKTCVLQIKNKPSAKDDRPTTVFVDVSKLQRVPSSECQVRVAYFVANLLLMNVHNQTCGVELIVAVNADVHALNLAGTFGVAYGIVSQALPLKVRMQYYIQDAKTSSKVEFLSKLLPQTMKLLRSVAMGNSVEAVTGQNQDQSLPGYRKQPACFTMIFLLSLVVRLIPTT